MFAYDSKLSVFLRACSDLLVINFLLLIFSLPVLTMGAALSAAYFTILDYQVRGIGYLFSTFFGAFKQNAKQGSFIWTIMLLLIALFRGNIVYFYQSMKAGHADGLLYILFAILLLLLVVLSIYTFAYVARFSDTTRTTLSNAGLLMLTHPRQNIQIALLLFIAASGIFFQPLLILIIPVLFLRMTVDIMEKIFSRYLPKADLESHQENDQVYTSNPL